MLCTLRIIEKAEVGFFSFDLDYNLLTKLIVETQYRITQNTDVYTNFTELTDFKIISLRKTIFLYS